MSKCSQTLAEIRSFVCAIVSVAHSAEGYSQDEIDFTLALLQREVETRCSRIENLYQATQGVKQEAGKQGRGA